MKLIRAFVIFVRIVLASGPAVAVAALPGCSRAQQAPTVGYTLLDGHKSDLASLRGRVVLVNFWATDCAPCVAEMPQLAATWRRFAPQGFDMLAVAMSYDPPAAVSNFAQTHALPFGVVIDNTGEVAARFGAVDVTPTTVLINQRGEIVKRWTGDTDFTALQAQIAHLLREG